MPGGKDYRNLSAPLVFAIWGPRGSGGPILRIAMGRQQMSFASRFAILTVLLVGLGACAENRSTEMEAERGRAGNTPNNLGTNQIMCPPGSTQPECLRPRTNPDD